MSYPLSISTNLLNNTGIDYPVNENRSNGNAPKESLRLKVSHCFKTAINHLIDSIRNAVSFLAYTASQITGVQALCKLGKSIIAFAKYAFKAQSEGFSNLQGQLEIVDGALDVADFLDAASKWVVPVKDPANPDGEKKVFWRHQGVSKWKIIGHAVGTVAKALGVVKFLMDVGLVKLGQLSNFVGSIPFFNQLANFSPIKFLKDGLSVIASSFAIVESGFDLKKLGVNGKIENLKLNKWKVKNRLRTYSEMNQEAKNAKLAQKQLTEVAYIEKLKQKYIDCRTALKNLKSTPKKEENLSINPDQKWAAVKIKYEDGQQVGVNTVKCNDKIKEKITHIKGNKVSKTNQWISIAFNAAKIAAVILGIIATLASITTPVFIGIMGAAWLAVSVIGMVKLYHGFKNRK